MERFTAVLGGGDDGDAPVVEVPFDVRQRYGRARAPVRGTVNGTHFRTTVAVYGGRYLLGFNKDLRERAGIAIGDEVEVALELDREPRTVEVPPVLAAALADDASARMAFEELSPSHRRAYADWISEAKREDTRARRVKKALAMLRDGARRP